MGPCIAVGSTEEDARNWSIDLEIEREGKTVFSGQTQINQIKRSFSELVQYLFRCQEFPSGAVLLTGSGIVPPNSFTLQARDVIRIAISGIGVLENVVQIV